jgi:hypothetical protein
MTKGCGHGTAGGATGDGGGGVGKGADGGAGGRSRQLRTRSFINVVGVALSIFSLAADAPV